jgi:hypothetical protein
MAGYEIVDVPVSGFLPAENSTDVEPDDFALPIVESAEKLSIRDRAMLIFERKWWRHAGSKEQAIREQFELSATRYYQVLNKLLDMPEALEFDPVTVGRLRRLRATRSRARSGRPSTAES